MLRGLDFERTRSYIDGLREILLGDIIFLKDRTRVLEELDILDIMRQRVIDLAACVTSVTEETAELACPDSTADLDTRDPRIEIGSPS